MRHSWILDVLSDLRAYADMNNLPAIAAAAAQTYAIAEVEIAAANVENGDTSQGGGTPD